MLKTLGNIATLYHHHQCSSFLKPHISIPDLTKLLNTVLHTIYIERCSVNVQRDILISSAARRNK